MGYLVAFALKRFGIMSYQGIGYRKAEAGFEIINERKFQVYGVN
jgi:hypothetical protein